MTRWRYRITTHTVPDILERVSGLEQAEDVPPTIFCDDQGACYFDAAPNRLTDAIQALLDQVGEEGWELVQIAFRPQELVAFWKQPA